MARVYSVQMFAGTAGPAASTLVTVPTGMVYVLRDFECSPDDESSPDWGRLYLSGPPGNPFVHTTHVAAEMTDQWQGRVVVNAGQSVRWVSATRTYRLVLSGYSLFA